MNTLRDDLRDLAAQAPDVDLAARAVQGARRRRSARLAGVAAAVVCLIAAGSAALFRSYEPPVVLTPPDVKAVPLPAKGVAPVEQLYQEPCESPCERREWRLVARDGAVYTFDADPGPVAVTPDGRRIGYFSAKQGTILIRDLAGGKIWKAPIDEPEKAFEGEYALRLSPSGLRFIVSGWGGRKEPNLLVDVERGTSSELKKGWFPVSVADGNGPVVLVKPYDKITQVWVLGRKPFTIQDFAYDFSPLASDGRSLARLTGDTNQRPREIDSIATIDVLRGGQEKARVRVTGLREGLNPAWLGAWVSEHQVMVIAVPERVRDGVPAAVYAVDVRTGVSSEMFAIRGDGVMVLPGVVR
ncbi:hypothetical protein SAMN05444920_101177 [Nonomuraea solani]|uniref:PQQ-like domain-containing protein n=1 Tax=Nonomuraea solani TaxID=1144553 RepID=A0A1H5TCC9_9ACTN|nr:hypothetical protein [Nonomuraea solani]SEF60410.1 hypothetical protein SAMN05444920_101177 [Nonomuraea solani]